jgi:hypothetical protein
MTYLAIGVVVAWLGGLLFLAGLYLNDIRLVLNSYAPGKGPTGDSLQLPPAYAVAAAFFVPNVVDLLVAAALLLSGRSALNRLGHFAKFDRSQLTEAGRAYLDKAVRHERIFFAFIVGGVVPIAWAVYLLSKS